MSLRSTLIDLETLAAQVGAPVRYELLKLPKKDPTRSTARGGLIRLGKDRFILCEKGLPAIDRIAVIAEALASLGVEVLDLPPVLRARISGRPVRLPARPKLVIKPLAKAL
ncbi:MAG: hypothetical protein ACXWUG_09475 [Polyangiales bacterium]